MTIRLQTPPPSTQGQAPARTEIGRYRLVRELATGGMATLYVAVARGPGGFHKPVAIKTIHPHLAKSPRFVDMFLDEARLASQLTHPNVCSVFDFGEAEGTYFLAMEYLLGKSLAEVQTVCRAATGGVLRVPAAVAARVVADACEGLHAAHELRDDRGRLLDVVHRDVSPHNLFVTWDGTTRVVDFGIARARNRLHETETGELKGKLAYMAPETVRGDEIDRRADVWALGVILWELLAGRALFAASGAAETLSLVTGASIPPPVDDLPPALGRVLARALRRPRDERYATAREMGEELIACVRPLTAGPGEVGRFLEELFPSGREEQVRALRAARQVVEEPAAPAGMGRSTAASAAHPPGPGPDGRGRVGATAVDERGWRWRRPGRITAAVALVGLAAVGGAVAASWAGMRAGPDTAKLDPSELQPAAVSMAVRPDAAAGEAPKSAMDGSPEQPSERAAGPVSASRSGDAAVVAAHASADPPPSPPAPSEGGARSPAARAATDHSARTSDSSRVRRPTGTVSVVTRGGWAHVYLGRRKLGTTPLVVDLPAGAHILRLHPFGREDGKPIRVRVRPGAKRSIAVSVAP